MTTSRPEGAPDTSAIRHGSKIGRFVVVAELGSGGMGIVYCAHDRELDRQVALKVMRGAGDAEADEDRIRMLREGQAMARVVHPNVITVFEVGTEGGVVFLAQELLDGGTLNKWLEQPHPEHEIIEKFVAAGRGLAAAHAVGLVHRDFKPDNVLLGKDGRVRVADFGLARAVGSFTDANMAVTDRGGGPPRTDDVTRSPMNNLTRTGAVMGTPMFMAPEQHEGRRADERSDQFAFCVALYHALHGDWPYEGKTTIALADNVINGVMKPPPRTARVSPRLRKILLRGLSTQADARYPSMDALLADLAAPPSSNKKMIGIGIAIAAAVLVAGAGAAVFVMLTGKPEEKPVVVEQPKPVVVQDDFDPSLLVRAVDQGTLAIAEKVFRNDATSMAQSSAAVMLALRGDLPGADAKLKEADASKGTDPKAAAYTDMAASAIAYARGELKTAAERSGRCASALSGSDSIGSAMCLQIQGDTAAEMDNVRLARDAYNSGSVIGQKLKDKQIESMFQLSVAQLDFDEKHEDVSLDAVTKLRKDARARRAASCEASAAVLASRILLRKADQQAALDQVDDLDPKILEAYRLQAIARIAVGEVYGYKNEADEDGIMGLDRIADVLDEAQKKQFWGVVLEAKLARVRVMITLDNPEGETERKQLIDEATSKGYARIARLAKTYNAKVESAPPNVESPPPPE